MSKNSKYYIPLIVITSIFAIVNILCGLRLFFTSTDFFNRISAIVNIISSIFAMFYVLEGCRKSSSDFFKGLVILICLGQLLNVVYLIYLKEIDLDVIMNIFALGLTLVLILVKNVGFNKSIQICLLVLICKAVSLFLNTSFINIINTISVAVLCGCTFAKYIDKANRHSKQK